MTHRNNCDCDNCFKIGGDPNLPGYKPPLEEYGPLDDNTLGRIMSDIPKPEPPKNKIKKDGDVNKKINIWNHIKWVWNFNPILWLILIGIAIPAMAVAMFPCGPCAFFLILLIEMLVVAFSAGVWSLWKEYSGDIKRHCRKWWESKPK